MTTKLLYLEDFNLLQSTAEIVEIIFGAENSTIILNETIFYPQGGGQPYDQGIITSDNALFQVKEVRFIDGIVHHIGTFKRGNFQKGDQVECFVDEERRKLNSRLHSAGHIVDMAVTALGLKWVPEKGYHFPEGPYVEYEGILGEQDREKLKIDIERACNDFVRENRKTELVFTEKDKLHELCHFFPKFIPEGKPVRVVMYGDFGVPCGGTHINSLGEVGEITIRKIKPKNSNIQIGYAVES